MNRELPPDRCAFCRSCQTRVRIFQLETGYFRHACQCMTFDITAPVRVSSEWDRLKTLHVRYIETMTGVPHTSHKPGPPPDILTPGGAG